MEETKMKPIDPKTRYMIYSDAIKTINSFKKSILSALSDQDDYMSHAIKAIGSEDNPSVGILLPELKYVDHKSLNQVEDIENSIDILYVAQTALLNKLFTNNMRIIVLAKARQIINDGENSYIYSSLKMSIYAIWEINCSVNDVLNAFPRLLDFKPKKEEKLGAWWTKSNSITRIRILDDLITEYSRQIRRGES